jgi:hypothetical protein
MPNDTENYPEDSFDNMKTFAARHGLTFPYVIDTTQEVARAYGAQCTPDFFGFNAQDELQYRGRLDASRMTRIANARRDLFEAMKQIADTGYGPKEATSIHGFDQMESLRCVWLSAFVGGAGRQLCVPKSHPFYLADQKNNGSFVEYEWENDNARANGTVLHQKCSPATAEGWPRACAQLRPCRMAGSKAGS